ncbi:MAG: hypothetical protein ACE5GD_00375 [Candidatus Geothermarchaeales archaeon]
MTVMVKEAALLTREDRELLVKTNRLLEELLETIDILEDKKTMQALREAERDVEAGRVRRYDEFIEELKGSDEI